MIFGNESISTYTRSNMAIWMLLAFQAGMLNIGGFMACHNFVSHVTGFAALFSLEFNKGEVNQALALLLVPLSFLVGTMVAGVLVDINLKLQRKPRYYIVFGVIFLLILLVVVLGFNNIFGAFGEPLHDIGDYTLLCLLCLICGLQNGTITLVSKSVVRTTHLTGITTDLGIGIVRVLNRRRLRGKIENEDKANIMRIGIILFFLLGSLLGARVFTYVGFRGFLLPCLTSFGLFFSTFYFQVLRHRLSLKS